MGRDQVQTFYFQLEAYRKVSKLFDEKRREMKRQIRQMIQMNLQSLKIVLMEEMTPYQYRKAWPEFKVAFQKKLQLGKNGFCTIYQK